MTSQPRATTTIKQVAAVWTAKEMRSGREVAVAAFVSWCQLQAAARSDRKAERRCCQGTDDPCPGQIQPRLSSCSIRRGRRGVRVPRGQQSHEAEHSSWGGFIGQWDKRISKTGDNRDWAISAHHPEWPGDFKARERAEPSPIDRTDYAGLREGYIKPEDVAWYASHYHTADGLNEPYRYSYLFAYARDVPANAKTLTLPNNDNIRVLAISVADENPTVAAAQPLSDTLPHTEQPTTQEPAQ
ncbi:MAG: hypothetical protein ABI197_03325 [Granulicella sp.]